MFCNAALSDADAVPGDRIATTGLVRLDLGNLGILTDAPTRRLRLAGTRLARPPVNTTDDILE